MSKSWNGEQELQAALQSLCGQYPIPNSKVKSVTAVANKFVSEFKMVVYEIEKFIKKANNEDKVGGLFVIDMLCRQSGKEKDIFAKRFAIRLKETIGYLNKIPNNDKASVYKVLDEWKRNGTFPSDVIGSIKLDEFAVPGAQSSASTKERVPAEAHARQPAAAPKAEEPKSSAPSSSSADAKKRSTKEEAKLKKSTKTDVEVKKAVKLCPFREGTCPFGEKCRFNHVETNTLEQYAVRLSKTLGVKRLNGDEISDAVCDSMDTLLDNSFHGINNEEKEVYQQASSSSNPDWFFARKKLKVDYTASSLIPIESSFYEVKKEAFDELFVKPL